jgi:putative membrane protein (TIGR04086 family)
MPDGDRRINALAIFLGVATDLGTALGGGVAIGVVIAFMMLAEGTPPQEVQAQLEGPLVQWIGVLLGFGSTLLGGYVAGRVAGCRHMLHGLIVGILGLLIGLLLSLLLGRWSVEWPTIASFLGGIPIATLGGWLAAGTRSAKRAQRSEPQSVSSRS